MLVAGFENVIFVLTFSGLLLLTVEHSGQVCGALNTRQLLLWKCRGYHRSNMNSKQVAESVQSRILLYLRLLLPPCGEAENIWVSAPTWRGKYFSHFREHRSAPTHTHTCTHFGTYCVYKDIKPPSSMISGRTWTSNIFSIKKMGLNIINGVNIGRNAVSGQQSCPHFCLMGGGRVHFYLCRCLLQCMTACS